MQLDFLLVQKDTLEQDQTEPLKRISGNTIRLRIPGAQKQTLAEQPVGEQLVFRSAAKATSVRVKMAPTFTRIFTNGIRQQIHGPRKQTLVEQQEAWELGFRLGPKVISAP